jgi:hypothetical protein
MNWKVAVSVVGLILLTRLVSAAPPLVDAAKKVCDASKWTGRPVYVWLSESKVISWQAPPKVADHHIPRTPFKGVAVNLDTGREESLPEFNKRLAHLKGEPIGARISPNAKWMLVLSYTGGFTWSAVALDGSRVIEGFNWYDGEGGVWNPDSLGWFTLFSYLRIRALQYSLHQPKGYQKVPFAGVDAFDKIVIRDGHKRRIFLVEGHDAQSPHLVGLTSAGRVLIDLRPRDDQGNVVLWDVGFGEKAAAPKLISIPLPKEGRLEEAVISPKGDRIAWRLKYFTKPPTGKEADEARVEIWVSGIDGSEMRLLGAQTVKNDDSTYDYCDSAIPCRVQWVPGGKSLSFVYKNALYVLPVQ